MPENRNTAFSVTFPLFARAMTDHLETHRSESEKQASLYYKIAIFKWITSVFALWIITPFSDTLSVGSTGMIPQVRALFITDMTVTNGIALLDPVGLFKHHIVAPRAKTQNAMNLAFQGTPYDLADCYTEMTRILLMSLFYSSIFPGAYFLCSMSLALKYFCGRYNLMRTWQRAPSLGSVISRVSRQYFFSLAVVIMALLSNLFWSGFPYDNLCPVEDSPIDPTYFGDFELETFRGDGEFEEHLKSVSLSDAHTPYRYCNMNFLNSFPNISFPFVPQSENEKFDAYAYMSPDQLITTTYFGWSAFAIVILVGLKYLFLWYQIYQSMSHTKYVPSGEINGKGYSEVEFISGYIPRVTSPMFSYPLIACNTAKIDDEYFEFTDPDRAYTYYDLTRDAKKLLASLDIGDPPGFTIVKSWAPDISN